MGRDHVENLRECVGRLANEWTKIAEGKEETSAVTGRDHRKDRRHWGQRGCNPGGKLRVY